MNFNRVFFFGLAVGGTVLPAIAGSTLERPSGFRIGDRMTLRPYVSTSLTYDSNVEGTSDSSKGDCLFTIAPAATLAYDADRWSALLSGYYNYRQYFNNCHQNYNHHSFGEDLRVNWSSSDGAEKGWSLILGESFQQINMADDMTLDGGQNYSGDQRQLQFAGTVQRRFNEHWHGDVNADYYWLDYLNDLDSKLAYYGWDRWRVGLETGIAPSQWTDFILSGSYQGYTQDNAERNVSDIGDSSTGWSVQGGIGSFMTERISYRVLAGWSRFEYGDGSSSSDGFIYTISGNWKIGETWNTMLLASSYYQPSERQYSSQSRVDSISWGLAKTLVPSKLRATLDLRYRRETNEHVTDSRYDYALDILTGRLGLSYTINRFVSVYTSAEYQMSMNSDGNKRADAYDYDRFRVTGGVMLSY